MTTSPSNHDAHHLERVALYALQALPAAEVGSVESEIAACPECRDELDALRPTLGALVSWPTDVLRPPTPLWGRVARRIGADGEGRIPPPASRAPAGEWEAVAPGITVKVLATDAERRRVTLLVRLAPGTDYPSHAHAGIEELHLLDGELMIDDRKLAPGDYSRAEPGTIDQRVWSETGCTCFLVTSPDDLLR